MPAAADSPMENESPFPLNSSFNTDTNVSRIFSFCRKQTTATASGSQQKNQTVLLPLQYILNENKLKTDQMYHKQTFLLITGGGGGWRRRVESGFRVSTWALPGPARRTRSAPLACSCVRSETRSASRYETPRRSP